MKYYDVAIGRSDEVLVWAYEVSIDRIEYSRGTHGTHETVFGKKSAEMWRGRLCLLTRMLSIVPPQSITVSAPPEWLVAELKRKFNRPRADPISAVWFFPGKECEGVQIRE